MYKTFEDFLRAPHASDSEAARALLKIVFELEPSLNLGDPEMNGVYHHEFVDVHSNGVVNKLRWMGTSWNWGSLEVWMDVDHTGHTVRLLYVVDEGCPESYSCHNFPNSADKEFQVFCKALEAMRKARLRV